MDDLADIHRAGGGQHAAVAVGRIDLHFDALGAEGPFEPGLARAGFGVDAGQIRGDVVPAADDGAADGIAVGIDIAEHDLRQRQALFGLVAEEDAAAGDLEILLGVIAGERRRSA